MLKLISNDIKLDFDDVLIVPQRSDISSRLDIDITRNFQFYHSKKNWDGIPVFASNMYNTGSFNMSDALVVKQNPKMGICLHKFHEPQHLEDFFHYPNMDKKFTRSILFDNLKYSFITIGASNTELSKLIGLTKKFKHHPNICIDIANGYSEYFVKFCASVRNHYKDSIIIAGNVCTPEMVSELILHGGVDIVKIGIGPGSMCCTRSITGIGYPQLSAISECAQVAHGLKSKDKRLGLIMADGGCKTPGDICKAFAAGADFVMIGGMLLGTDECDGVRREGFTTPELKCYGMSSFEAQKEHYGEVKPYRASEGSCEWVPTKGPVKDVLQQITGGIRSCCSYVGASCLKDLSKCAKFVRISK